MLTQVVATNTRGSVLSLPLEDISGGISVQEIQGLDPVKATIVTSSFASSDGTQYLAARREDRNLVFTLGMEPDPSLETVRDVRKRLYDFFMPKTNVSLKFWDDALDLDISGMIESCEAPLFVQEPSMQVSIMCFDPDFVDLTPVVTPGSTNSDGTETSIQYDGTVDSGIIFELDVNRDVDAFSIFCTPPSGVTQRLDFEWQLHAGDVVTINSISRQKAVTLTRTSVPQSLLYGMTPQSSWIHFEPGENVFRVNASGASIPYTVTFNNRYGGL